MYFFLYLLASVNLLYIIHLGLYSIGANSYDILSYKRAHDSRKKQARKPATRSTKQPLVSVVIPAHNEGEVIKRTLDSVMASSYDNLEVIVVDDGSIDNTAQFVRDYIKKAKRSRAFRVRSYFNQKGYFATNRRFFLTVSRKTTKIRLVRQKNQGKAAAMNHAIRDFVAGKYVMCLDADSILHPKAVERAVSHFKDRRVIGVAANVRVIGGKNWLGRLQRFEHMVGYRSKKFYAVANCEFIIGGVASTYRRSVLKQVKFYDNDTMTEDIGLSLKIVAKQGNQRRRIFYASDVVALTEGVQSFKDLIKQRYRWKMGNLQNLFKYRRLIGEYQPSLYSRTLTLYRLPMAIVSELMLIIEPLILGYVVYLSITYHTLSILTGAYITITGYILTVLWSDEHLPVKEKFRLSLSALWIYVLFYVMDVVQTCAMVKSLRFYKKIIHRGSELSTWVSPKRTKQIQTA